MSQPQQRSQSSNEFIQKTTSYVSALNNSNVQSDVKPQTVITKQPQPTSLSAKESHISLGELVPHTQTYNMSGKPVKIEVKNPMTEQKRSYTPSQSVVQPKLITTQEQVNVSK